MSWKFEIFISYLVAFQAGAKQICLPDSIKGLLEFILLFFLFSLFFGLLDFSARWRVCSHGSSFVMVLKSIGFGVDYDPDHVNGTFTKPVKGKRNFWYNHSHLYSNKINISLFSNVIIKYLSNFMLNLTILAINVT